MLELDPVLFEQVLFNLLDNAAKYAPPETTIRIESWQDGETVMLQVIDEGSGIPPEELERVFEKFHRAYKGDQVRAGNWTRTGDLARFCRSDGRHDRCRRTDRIGRAPSSPSSCLFPEPTERLDTAA